MIPEIQYDEFFQKKCRRYFKLAGISKKVFKKGKRSNFFWKIDVRKKKFSTKSF